MQASTSGSQREQQRNSRRSSNFGQPEKLQPQEKQAEQQTTQWNFRVMTYNILAEGLVGSYLMSGHTQFFFC